MRKTMLAAMLSAICLGLFATGVQGQGASLSPFLKNSESSDELNPPLNVNYASLARPSASPANMVDNSIDEGAYFVGGGDVFHISIVNIPSMNCSGVVNQNGDLYIPTLGLVPLGKVTLARAKELIAESVRRQLKKPNAIYISLQKVKIVTVSVSGAVTSPGTYELPGTLRLWDAIKAANNSSKDPRSAPINLCDYDLRAVRRSNRDSTSYFDLLSFLYKGDIAQNPYIYPGDQLVLFPAANRVYVYGEVKGALSGMVPIRSNERLSEFLSLFTLGANADSGHILVQRNDESNQSFAFNMKQKSGLNVDITSREKSGNAATPVLLHNDGNQTTDFDAQQGSDFNLKNGDIITIPTKTNASEVFVVTVNGEVARPGMYPIAKNATSPQAIIELAGRYNSYANADKTVIIRNSKLSSNALTPQSGKASSIGEFLTSVRPELSSGINMMFATKDFSIIRIKDHPETCLEPWDQIVVPRMEHVVYVSGNVKRPGGYRYEPNKGKSYYINLAGGLTGKANKSNIYLIASYGDVLQACDRDVMEDGDVIVVPMSQEFKAMSTIVIPIAGIVLSALGVSLGLFSTLHK